ncbi:AzlC family ABC transporter permease [Aliiruegeria lutimaris]|uniref:4-azaleucine resistance probable transporter AzlC n=1 Tax=Aliiruegeria lutimaris TaxID=571298 RepID=A0A1G8R1C5_9RHOB|nr:AzlC family ABC transporter permease [Aliiruegeria lutimaris]SDJ10779.1 4-azaleucine resistance probable transporter AzlC [Aliiruegeria lutimaris]
MTQRAAFWRGYRDTSPFVLIIIPYSTLFGVVARDAGLDILQTFSMSVLVIAGASQFTALALLQDNAPVLIALLAALAVNLRMAMYSAALVPHVGHTSLRTRALMAYVMVDQAFAVAVHTYEDNPGMTRPEKVAYYFGCMALICPLWYAFTLLGAIVGTAIPSQFSLDFAVPVCFIALLGPLLRSLPHVLAALVAAVAALAFAWVPWSLGLIIAALCGIVTGAQAELYLRRRADRGLA